MILARRSYACLLVALGIGLVLAGLGYLGAGALVLGLLDSLVLLLAALDARRTPGVEVERLPLGPLSIGRDNLVTLQIKVQHPTHLLMRDGFPPEFSASQLEFICTLKPGPPHQLTYTVRPDHRGEYNWGAVALRQRGPWQLAWRQQLQPQPQTKVAVYPDLLGLKSLSVRLALENTGSVRQLRRQGMGTDFAELREYTPGDDPRLIDWKATARQQRILLRVLEPEREQTLIVLLDRGRLMTARVAGLTRFDWGLNAALALALAGLHRGDRVGVGVFDRQMHTWIPPQRAHLGHLVKHLTPLQPELLEPDYPKAITTVTRQQRRRALVVVITDIIDSTAAAELLLALESLAPHHLPFCVTLQDPLVSHQANQEAIDLDSAYRRAVALDLLAQRKLVFARLKSQGVLGLDAPANQVSTELVNQYLRLKAQHLL